MKREVEQELRQLGWWMARQGTRHEVWTNGSEQEPVPRHREIAENLARKALRSARRHPGARR
jgi:mRNA interferase HicA